MKNKLIALITFVFLLCLCSGCGKHPENATEVPQQTVEQFAGSEEMTKSLESAAMDSNVRETEAVTETTEHIETILSETAPPATKPSGMNPSPTVPPVTNPPSLVPSATNPTVHDSGTVLPDDEF